MTHPTLSLVLGGALCMAASAPTTVLAHDQNEDHLVRLYQHLAPATVYLSVIYDSLHPLSDPSTTGVGAGFIIDKSGTVLTNAHVVDGATIITVTLFDGNRVTAELLALDSAQDIAILRLPPAKHGYPTVALGDSKTLHIGQQALVVGSPFGLGFTLTSGIISGLGPATGLPGTTPTRIIQTTAPINPGNSGGPLVDSKGEVIGITTATLMGAQNIGFAIPINTAKEVVAEFTAKGSITRPWLGIGGKFPADQMIALFAIPLAGGLIIEDVEDGSPAAEAGVKSGTLRLTVEDVPWVLGGDILLSLNGHPTIDPETFAKAIKPLAAGQQVEVEILRNGEHRRLWIVLRERPRGSLRPKTISSRPTVGLPSHGLPWKQQTQFIPF